ncbi:MAG: efflux RND transporter periplasmic adaptor subunit, partial [Candidatus Hydrogenedentes bacterium]|nr:efflux RND transporter periplasmic adaptor subunit [Candidatus Hydrogenedentota bacterium]
MHPQIRMRQAGQCPICGMDLIPVSGMGAESPQGSLRTYQASEPAIALMDLRTHPVERRFVTAEIRMAGKVDYDETRLGYITAWVPGRLDRLYVDYTGVKVNKGDHMVYLYSPEILAAQEELRRAANTVANMRADAPDILRKTAQTTLEAAREKLGRWGLTDEQLAEAEKRGTVNDHITIYAPMGGTVIERMGQEGMYVETGTTIYTIADLSEVWVLLDAYESDLPWIHYGQTVEFTSEAYPGETFEGRIAFIDPVLDDMTRTVKVRVNVPNKDGRLKPEMFVRAVVRAQLATGGRVADASLAGKWISPMHPEIVKDHPGNCDICGMPLVRAETLGYVPAQASEGDKPLVIPASAALITGKRAIVYVEIPGTQEPTYEGREVVLGPRAGDYYIVRSGVDEGEILVTNGNFKIDSALQILAKPSMMTPEGGAGSDSSSVELSAVLKGQLEAIDSAFEGVGDAVRNQDREKIRRTLNELSSAIDAVDMKLFPPGPHAVWMEYSMRLRNDL